MNDTQARIAELKETARNINSLDTETRERLQRHLLGRHGGKMPGWLKDRVKMIGTEYQIDPVCIDGLEKLGITL